MQCTDLHLDHHPLSDLFMRALALYAGPAALRHIQQHGLQPRHVLALPAAAGGPKGLMLLRLDRFLFGDWLPQSQQPIDLIGASIGAWRWAAACMPDPVAALQELERIYVQGDFGQQPGERTVAAQQVSAAFARCRPTGRMPPVLARRPRIDV